MIAKTSKGKAIPIPKKRKFRKFVIKASVDVLTANKTAREAGLHGRTIAPKKVPKRNALKRGFFRTGAWTLGMNLPMSTLKIRRILTRARIAKAIGDTIPITFVNEALRTKTKINPITNIEIITPKLTTTPNKIICFLESFVEVLLAR